MKKDPIIMGIDPGSNVSGYALLEKHGRKLSVLEYGVIRNKVSMSLLEKLGNIHLGISKLLEDYKPDMVALEGSFFHKNARTALVLGQTRGAIMAACAKFSPDFYEIAPKSVKQAICGRGGATKEEVALMVQKHLKLVELPKPADAADALAIAWAIITRPDLAVST